MGISAVILAHDNEDSIADTLSSVSFCDEVLVIDDGSVDKTVSIARKMGATVYTRSLDDDFAAQRNFGLEKARGPWVLFVDSDETVPDAMANEIQKVTRETTLNGYYLLREDVMWGRQLKHGETANVRLLRLGKKGDGVWHRPIHEVWDMPGEVGTLGNALRHVPHPDVAHFLDDINRYSTLNARHFFRSGVRTRGWQIVGYPTAKFIQNYIIRKGFLDSTPGIIVALMMSFHSFLTRSKLWHLQKKCDK